LVRAPRPSERWLDVGSGAGFPGLVLACCFPEASFTLLEPLKKRAGFLQLVTTELGLANVAVDDRRLDQLSPGGFDVAVARALKSPNEALEGLLNVVRLGGDALVAAGPSETPEPAAELVQLEGVGFVDSPGRFFMMSRGG
jgi:16S rRNA (guanine527-N7)-methyltransferase